MKRARVKTFKSGNSTAVLLPRVLEVAPGIEMEAVREGGVITLKPVSVTLAGLVRQLEAMPKPSTIEPRPEFEAPERHGL